MPYVGLLGGGFCPKNTGHSWMWVEELCINLMRIAVNRGFGGIAGKSANVQLRVFVLLVKDLQNATDTFMQLSRPVCPGYEQQTSHELR